jgi:hypothetical protein
MEDTSLIITINGCIDWNAVRDQLTHICGTLLDRGSIGVSKWTEEVKPLWDRYFNGERTKELHDAIMEYEV